MLRSCTGSKNTWCSTAQCWRARRGFVLVPQVVQDVRGSREGGGRKSIAGVLAAACEGGVMSAEGEN